MDRPAQAWRYGPLTTSIKCAPDADDLFRAMMEDLVLDGDVEKALQKAFRWGYEDEDGDDIPGLRDIIQRVREDREELQQNASGEVSQSEDAGDGEGFGTDEDEGQESSIDVSGRVTQLERIEKALKQIESLDDLRGLDPQLVDSTLSDDEREWIEQWMSMTGRLVESGLIVEGTTRLELSPEAIRRIGAHALRAMYLAPTHEGVGEHELYTKGTRGPTTDTSSTWQFGQPFSLHLTRTILNAVYRQGPGRSVRLRQEDFEALDRESTSANATVLLIDMSRSMFHNGCWDAAKRAALALDTLMRTQFPRDALEIVGFSGTAVRLQLSQMPALTWDEFSHGTNLQSGLAMARHLLRDYGTMNRQVILITDGEPTAFTESGETIFENPATERTFQATLSEVVRCTRDKVGITTFLLDESPELIGFVRQMTGINRGRVIQTAPNRLGRYLIRDFAAQHTRVVGV